MGSILNTQGLGIIPDNRAEGPGAGPGPQGFSKAGWCSCVGRSERRWSGEPPPPKAWYRYFFSNIQSNYWFFKQKLVWISRRLSLRTIHQGNHMSFFLKKQINENILKKTVGSAESLVDLAWMRSKCFYFRLRGVRVHSFPELNPDHHRKERLLLWDLKTHSKWDRAGLCVQSFKNHSILGLNPTFLLLTHFMGLM